MTSIVGNSSSDGKPYGKVYVVGNGKHYGELGGDLHEITHPIPLEELRDEFITEVAAGKYHSLAINKDGKMLAWGCNNYGALGIEESIDEVSSLPTLINHTSMCYIQFSKVACGNTFSMALSTKGQIYTWGTFMSSNHSQIIGYLPQLCIQYYPRIVNALAHENIIEIAAGNSHCLALSDKGKVFSWGSNEQYQLGRSTNDMIYDALNPDRVKELPSISHISSGAYHSFAIDEHGRLYAWGLNHFEQCGFFSSNNRSALAYQPCEYIPTPRPVPYFYNTLVIKVEEDLKEEKNIFGKRAQNQQVEGKSKIVIDNNNSNNRRLKDQIKALRKLHITSDSTTGAPVRPKRETIVSSSTIESSCDYPVIKSISAGDAFTVISTKDNKLIVFGQCDRGQLGMTLHPDSRYQGDAIKIPTVNKWQCKEQITNVVSGSNHTLVLTKEGVVYGFGQSTNHQLGVYSEEDVYIPTMLQSLFNAGKVIGASTGDHHSLFIVNS